MSKQIKQRRTNTFSFFHPLTHSLALSSLRLPFFLRFYRNAVELLISILALVGGDIDLVQAAMIGSILSNTLLVLGMCYFAGGLRFHEQVYAVASSQLQISLLGVSITAIILPAAFDFAVNGTSSRATEQSDLLALSRWVGEELRIGSLSTAVLTRCFDLSTEVWHSCFFRSTLDT